ncbi:MAG: efflux RND transporter periplasmic adaptor subunit [Alphaproteobacteria bacterium]|nr:efflux RND transporter periplasmic adaptor subunit [Alphaproteobacteria bacterium]
MKQALFALAVLLVLAPTAHGQQPADKAPRLRALLAPRIEAGLSTQITALVADLTVRPGDSFKKGDVLIRFDCAMQRAQLQKTQADFAAARKTVLVKRDLARLNSAGELEVEMAEAAVAKAEADVAITSAVVSYCVLKAPFDGRVVDVKVWPHEGAQPGQKLLQVIDDSELEAEVIVPSSWLKWLKTGIVFTVRIDETGDSYSAVVTRLGSRVDAVSQSIKIYGTIKNRPSELVAGMSGEASFDRP